MSNISNILGFKCIACSREYAADKFRYTCASCGNNLDIVYDYDSIKKRWNKDILLLNKDRSLWRYKELFPVKSSPVNLSLQVGGTPLVDSSRIAEELDLKNVWIKDDTRNPSGSLKDRASEIGLQHAFELGQKILVAASTGNAAASLACLSAYHGLKALILAPASAPKAKLVQILQYGAELILVDGSYDDAFDLSVKIVDKYGLYSRSTGINPVLSEGKKTVALEIAEQLNWEMPDYVLVPVGDGCIIGGVYKGFYDLLNLGWINNVPRIVAVQSEGSSAIVNALENESNIQAVKADTVADSISVDMPRDGLKALRAVRDSDGFGIKVSDRQILEAQKKLAENTGIFAEPAAATSYAGLFKAKESGKIDKNSSVVILATGTGLKDINAASSKICFPEAVKPEISSIKDIISKIW